MSKALMYDTIGSYQATLTGSGVILTAGNWYTDTGAPSTSNEPYLVDFNLRVSTLFTSSYSEYDIYKGGVRIDAGAVKTVDLFSFYIPSALSGYVIKLYGSNSSATGYVPLGTIVSPTVGWNVVSFTSKSLRYFVIQIERATAFTDIAINEVLIGEMYTFLHPFKIGEIDGKANESKRVKVRRALGGETYSTKYGTKAKRFKGAFEGLTDSNKSDLEAVDDGIDGEFKKLLYSLDGTTGTFYWVRMTGDSLEFVKKDGRWATTIEMLEQIV